MAFPLNLDVIEQPNKLFTSLSFHNGCLTLLGPNGSGKTQLLRKIKNSIHKQLVNNKKVRYLSAGRMGLFEQYRSDFDGHRGGLPLYDNAEFGQKSDANRRHQYETINGDFQTLSIRADIQIKVQERLNKLFNRSFLIDWDGALKVSFIRNDIKSGAYSSAREASGLIHLVAILAAIYDDEVGALLLDEPEVSLHPQLQSFLMKEIEKYAGDVEQNKKLIVLATHSTEFIKISSAMDLCNIVFCYTPEKPPIQLNPDMDVLKSKKLNEFLSRIGQEHKLAFFSNRPLLVEGISDSIICHGIERKLDLFIDAAGVQIVPIMGKGEFPVVYKLFKMIGKEPIILTDADSFTDSMDIPQLFSGIELANSLASQKSFGDLHDLVKKVYDDFCKFVDAQKNNYQDLLENTPYWKNKKDDDDLTTIYRRAFLTLIYSDTTHDFLSNHPDIVTMKARLDSLFDVLESVGCFILRKGTIESYYTHTNKDVSCGKPIIAVGEIEYLNNQENSFVATQYSDIVRCLQYASTVKEINETEALTLLLSSVLAPVLVSLKDDTTQSEINTIIRNTIGTRGELFEIILVETNKNKITVHLKSNILDKKYFPFEIDKSDNLIQTINSKLGLAK